MSGGKELERKLAEIAKKLSKRGVVRVGFLERSKYPDGTPVAMIAAIQDFGAPSVGIPPRPFFRNMVADKKGEWPAAIRGLLESSDYDVAGTLRQTGEAIAGQLRQSIYDTNEPPLKPATIRARIRRSSGGPPRGATGIEKPLVDTGLMFQSVDYEVEVD